jgi:D-glycero-D-manno-heptose 1,7-bisphosphate phosphatase
MIQQVFQTFPKPLNGLILADRDGTLIQDEGYFHNYLSLRFIEEDMKVFRVIRQLNLGLALVTNQSGIGRGFFEVDDAMKVHSDMASKILEAGGQLHRVIFCPHTPDDRCLCRKPSPLMLNQVSLQTGLPLQKIAFFGNAASDEQAAINAGIHYYSTLETSFSLCVYSWIRKNFSDSEISTIL